MDTPPGISVRHQPVGSSSGSPLHPPPLLADPLLALAADVLGDLEKVRIANENRLRQLTRSAEDSDGETRGFGLDEAHPDVARLAALVGMLGEAEHKATLNLQRVMRKHPLGPWVAAQKGIGEKQGARLLATIGDPYIRPEITREDGTVEPSRPRMVSELWAYCGYHVIPAGQVMLGTQCSRRRGAERERPRPWQPDDHRISPGSLRSVSAASTQLVRRRENARLPRRRELHEAERHARSAPSMTPPRPSTPRPSTLPSASAAARRASPRSPAPRYLTATSTPARSAP